MSATTHYERLGVGRGVDAETLRRAFRRLSKSVHPDTTTLPAAEAARQLTIAEGLVIAAEQANH